MPPVSRAPGGDVCPGVVAAMRRLVGSLRLGTPVQGRTGIAVAELSPVASRGGEAIMEERDRWFVGIDWATEEHQVCVENAVGAVVGEQVFAHSRAGLEKMCEWLAEVSGAAPAEILVAIEVPHGAVVETLLERGFGVLAINPKQLDRFRDRFTLAGAKDDRRDAQVLARSLRTDRVCFRALKVDDPVVVELREWSRMGDELQRERVRLANRIREQLRRYYPQVLDLHPDVAADWVLALWKLAPTPREARRVRRLRVAGILKAYRIRKTDADGVLAVLRQTPLNVAPGTAEAASAHIGAVAERAGLVNRQLRDAHRRIDRLIEQLAGPEQTEDSPGQRGEQRDVEILQSLPGVGRIVLATLLAEAAGPLRERDYHALRSLAGVAPVTRRSGKHHRVAMRNACHGRLRNALYHWSRVAMQRDPRSRQRYAALRQRGHSHARALRTVGDRNLSVACAMLRNQEVFDPARCPATVKQLASGESR